MSRSFEARTSGLDPRHRHRGRPDLARTRRRLHLFRRARSRRHALRRRMAGGAGGGRRRAGSAAGMFSRILIAAGRGFPAPVGRAIKARPILFAALCGLGRGALRRSARRQQHLRHRLRAGHGDPARHVRPALDLRPAEIPRHRRCPRSAASRAASSRPRWRSGPGSAENLARAAAADAASACSPSWHGVLPVRGGPGAASPPSSSSTR